MYMHFQRFPVGSFIARESHLIIRGGGGVKRGRMLATQYVSKQNCNLQLIVNSSYRGTTVVHPTHFLHVRDIYSFLQGIKTHIVPVEGDEQPSRL